MEQQFIEANGLKFVYYKQGTGDNLILCLHGFPDTPYTWLDLMPHLASAGYRVIAPYMRGYPPTESPADNGYLATDLAADVIGLLDAFNAQKATLIGHDWGAMAAYAATALAPDRIHKLVTLAIPHPRVISLDAKSIWKARHFITFQFKRMASSWIKRCDYASIGKIFKRWSPNWEFTSADTDPVRESLSQPGGVEGALSYYWSFAQGRKDTNVRRLLGRRTSIPTLTLLGTADGALTLPDESDVRNAYKGYYEHVVVPGVGHFLHREAPDQITEIVSRFLNADGKHNIADPTVTISS